MLIWICQMKVSNLHLGCLFYKGNSIYKKKKLHFDGLMIVKMNKITQKACLWDSG